MNERQIGKEVVDAAGRIHSALGPGLLESVYQVVLAKERERRGFPAARQVPVPIEYEGMKFDGGFRADMIVGGIVIPQRTSVEQLSEVHFKQLFTSLKLKRSRLGYVLNFGAAFMKDGIKRVVNGLPEGNLGVLASWRETESNGQQAGARQPATLPESKSEGGDKPQTESEGRTRLRVSGLDVRNWRSLRYDRSRADA